jgi:4-amino-4-deoxy-L-arabinose transferase-like glycosyltransferase
MFQFKPSRLLPQQGLILFLLLLLALIPRFYLLGQVPPGLSGDELFNLVDARMIGPGYWPVFLEGNNGREVLFFYLLALSTRLFGATVFAVRLPAALLGVGTVLLIYLIGLSQHNRRIAIVAAGLAAVSLWPVMLSHWGLRAISLAFFTALTVYLFGAGLESGRLRHWLLGGAFLGLTLYTYIPSRLFPAVIAAWFAWIFFSHRRQLFQNGRHLVLSLLLALVVFAPFGLYMLRYPDKVNQRIYGMRSALDEARDGNPAALVPSVMGVARMFTIEGDGEWRYHLAGRPLFDRVTGLFFYGGVLVCLWYVFRRGNGIRERPRFALLLLWLGAMLVPNAVLDANSSFLRAAGAVAPLYLITAIGADTLYGRLYIRWPGVARWAPALLAAALFLTLADTWRGYFHTWSNHPEVRLIYGADVPLMARFLEQNPPPEGARVFIAGDYVVDALPRYWPLYSDRPVTWFAQGGTLPWPDPAADVTTWYLLPAVRPTPAETLSLLKRAGRVVRVSYADGQPAFTLYTLTSSQLSGSPQSSVRVAFAGNPTLIGYDLPPALYRGDTTSLVLHWQIPSPAPSLPNQLTFLEVQLEDEKGNAWSKAGKLMGYPQVGWSDGDHILEFLEVAVPAGMVPGPAYLRFRLRDADGRLYQVVGQATERTGPFLVQSRPTDNWSLRPGQTVFGDVLALGDHAFSTLAEPGLPLNISLEWLALTTPLVDYQVALQLIEPESGATLLRQVSPLWPGVYPPSSWSPGEQVTTYLRLDIPADFAASGELDLHLEVVEPEAETLLPLTQGSSRLAGLKIQTRTRLFEAPPIGNQTNAQFSDDIVLLGYDLDSRSGRAGGELHLTLYWQALATPPENYTVFNHLVDRQGQMQGQFDAPPGSEAWLTATWSPGEIIIDRRVIPIRPEAAPGVADLVVGLYIPGDGRRLPVSAAGIYQANDQLILTAVDLSR